MNDQETIQDYCYDEAAFDYHDRAYIPLQVADAPEQPLRIPEILKPDQETATDVYYTITAQTGAVQLLQAKRPQPGDITDRCLAKPSSLKMDKPCTFTISTTCPK